MKYFTLVLGLILFTSCAHVSTTSPPVNFTGKWKGAIRSKKGFELYFDFDFNFKCDGKSLTGTAREKRNRPDKSLKVEHGKIDGNKFIFIVKPEGKLGGRDVTYRFHGKYIGENMIELSLWVLQVNDRKQIFNLGEATFNIERVY